MKKFLILFLFMAMITGKIFAQKTVAAKDASKHIGETIKICDRVFGGNVTGSNVTLLYFGGNYPNHLFTVVINNVDRVKFKGKSEIDYRGKDFIVTGRVINHEGKPVIIATEPSNLKVVMIDNDHTVMLRHSTLK